MDSLKKVRWATLDDFADDIVDDFVSGIKNGIDYDGMVLYGYEDMAFLERVRSKIDDYFCQRVEANGFQFPKKEYHFLAFPQTLSDLIKYRLIHNNDAEYLHVDLGYFVREENIESLD